MNPPKKIRRPLTAAVGSVITNNKILTGGLLLVISGAVFFALLPPLVLEQIINQLTAGQSVIFTGALIYLAMLTLAGIFDSAKEVLITVLGQKITRELRHRMCAKLSRLPAAYYARTDPGVTVSRFVNDVTAVDSLFTSGIVGMFVDCCQVLSILAMIFVKSTGLGLLLLLITPLLFLLTRCFQKRMLQAQIANRAAVGQVAAQVPETMRNIRMIHVFGKENFMLQRYNRYLTASYRAIESANFYDSLYSPLINIISAAVIAVMMIFAASGGTMQTFFGMTVGAAVAVIAYVGRIFAPLESIGMEIQNIQTAAAGVARINEFLGETERRPTDMTITCSNMLASGAPCIELRQVSFGYEPTVPVLHDFSLVINKGENVTLTGRTGAGKSTIFKLLLGLYSPTAGNVLIYGQPADRIPDCEKRRLFGYVEQAFYSVPGTVAEQITLFDPTISDNAVRQALTTVGLADTINNLPAGYQTLYSDALFSQGQRQLLAIARAIAADPAILLLDEITANLDAATEATVLEALTRAASERTVLSISHRLYEKNGGRQVELQVSSK